MFALYMLAAWYFFILVSRCRYDIVSLIDSYKLSILVILLTLIAGQTTLVASYPITSNLILVIQSIASHQS